MKNFIQRNTPWIQIAGALILGFGAYIVISGAPPEKKPVEMCDTMEIIVTPTDDGISIEGYSTGRQPCSDQN